VTGPLVALPLAFPAACHARALGTLLALAGHPNVVRAREMVVGSSLDKVYLVMDFAPHNARDYLARLPPGASFTAAEVKCLARQLLRGLAQPERARREVGARGLLCARLELERRLRIRLERARDLRGRACGPRARCATEVSVAGR
jgi:serine/threonine protein kinase